MSRNPLTDGEIELIRLEADRHWKAQAEDTLRLVADLRAARAELESDRQRAEAAATHIRDLRRLLRDAEARRSEQQDRAKRAEARLAAAEGRLAAVIALCERTYGAATGYRELVIDACAVRAAAMGNDPEGGS